MPKRPERLLIPHDKFSSRRRIIVGGSATLIAALSPLARTFARQTGRPTVVDTTSGRVRGLLRPSGLLRFRGIPYGAPTGGKNRFRPPKPAPPWPGVRDALTWGAPCLQ